MISDFAVVEWSPLDLSSKKCTNSSFSRPRSKWNQKEKYTKALFSVMLWYVVVVSGDYMDGPRRGGGQPARHSCHDVAAIRSYESTDVVETINVPKK